MFRKALLTPSVVTRGSERTIWVCVQKWNPPLMVTFVDCLGKHPKSRRSQEISFQHIE